MNRPIVRAAGGVVWRDDPGGRGGVEIVVVHRPPPRDDWSLPKGKLEPGERHRDAALREVREETGLRCELADRLAEIRYDTPTGEDKRIRWWAMTVVSDDGFTPNREIDDLRWIPVGEAERLLSWPTDHEVLRRFRGLPRPEPG